MFRDSLIGPPHRVSPIFQAFFAESPCQYWDLGNFDKDLLKGGIMSKEEKSIKQKHIFKVGPNPEWARLEIIDRDLDEIVENAHKQTEHAHEEIELAKEIIILCLSKGYTHAKNISEVLRCTQKFIEF